MSVYFTGCTHLGHRAITKYRPWVKSVQHNTEIFLNQWNKTIKKKDVIYCLGDIAFDLESLNLLKDLTGRKILVKGNHDNLVTTMQQMEIFEEIDRKSVV